MKIISLLKAILSEDMNLFKYKTKKKGIFKILIPILLFFIIGFSIGSLLYTISEELSKYHLTYVILSLMLMFTSLMTFIEGIVKSQSILFDCKDNDLLFSLPIKRSTILFIRIFKLLLFEYLYNLMLLLPAFIVYIILEHPNISFYLLSILIFILIPIIPTIISCFIGYIIKLITSKMKSRNIIQTILTLLLFLPVLYFSLNSENMMNNIVKNATSINDIITSIYYPVGLCISLILKYNIIDFIKLILINVIPFIIFIIIGQIFYFRIISNSKNNKKTYKADNNIKIRVRKPIISLTRKELKRYFKSPVLMFNTSFGLIIIVIFTLILCLKGKTSLINLLSNYGISKNISINMLFYGIISFSLAMTSITSSSISLEGKTINITKSLPIDYKIILKSKILNCYIIELPFVIISILLFIVFFKTSILFIIQLLLAAILLILLNATVGLIINLKYPKLNANNDTEVVKQSTSSLISVAIGFGIFIISIIGFIFLYSKLNLNILITIHLIILITINIILYQILMKNGPKNYKKLNV